MKTGSRDFWETFPLLTVKDGIIVSKRGDLTIGWRLTLPAAYSVSKETYNDMNERFHGAIRSLPAWMLVHRQDTYFRRRFNACSQVSFLGSRNDMLFDGREYLEHCSYIFLTLSSKVSALRPAGSCGIYGLSMVVGSALKKDVARLRTAGSEFIHRITDSGVVKASRMDDDQLMEAIQDYISLGRKDVIPTDRKLEADRVELDGMHLWTYALSESKYKPSAIEPTAKVERVSSPLSPLTMSTGAAMGCLLDCEHIVNSYFLTLPDSEIQQELKASLRNKISMSKRNIENTSNAEEIEEYNRTVHSQQLVTVKAHNNLMVWGREDEVEGISAQASTALSSMGITCSRNTFDNCVIWYSSVPGGGCELGKQNFRTAELLSSLCLGISETYQRGIPGGLVRLCDRTRHIPLRLDFQQAAESAGLIANYNAFILGPSGSGKSFFTNHVVRSLYDANEKIVIIDLGHSYKGLCSIIQEVSHGKDGIYMTWNPDNPISFDAFYGFEEWLNESGRLRCDNEGVTYLEAIIKSIWEPSGGWNSERSTILLDLIERFAVAREKSKPIFNDLYNYITDTVIPMQMSGKLKINDVAITTERFDVSGMSMSLKQYSKQGQYSFLYNDPSPKDLFGSRLTVFEVSQLKEMGEKTFYPQCVLGIMLSFNRIMRSNKGWKTLIIEEAWQAIANEQMSGFLKELWKTSRKHSTSAIIVTQELTDILGSDVIRDTILQNSATKILLSQDSNLPAIKQMAELFGLTEHEKAMVMSIGYGQDPRYRYKEVFVSIGGKHRGVYGTELSPQEGYAYQSNMSKKEPFLKLAAKEGYLHAADIMASRYGYGQED